MKETKQYIAIRHPQNHPSIYSVFSGGGQELVELREMGIGQKNTFFFSFSVNFSQREKYKLLLLCFSLRRYEQKKENTFIMSGLDLSLLALSTSQCSWSEATYWIMLDGFSGQETQMLGESKTSTHLWNYFLPNTRKQLISVALALHKACVVSSSDEMFTYFHPFYIKTDVQKCLIEGGLKGDPEKSHCCCASRGDNWGALGIWGDPEAEPEQSGGTTFPI